MRPARRNLPYYMRMRVAGAHWYPCPGWVGDPKPAPHKFDRWNKRPQSAWRLYWVARPALYERMIKQHVR